MCIQICMHIHTYVHMYVCLYVRAYFHESAAVPPNTSLAYCIRSQHSGYLLCTRSYMPCENVYTYIYTYFFMYINEYIIVHTNICTNLLYTIILISTFFFYVYSFIFILHIKYVCAYIHIYVCTYVSVPFCSFDLYNYLPIVCSSI